MVLARAIKAPKPPKDVDAKKASKKKRKSTAVTEEETAEPQSVLKKKEEEGKEGLEKPAFGTLDR